MKVSPALDIFHVVYGPVQRLKDMNAALGRVH
jgi:hypothetical protein